MGKLNTFLKLARSNASAIPEAIFNNMIHLGMFNWMSDQKFLKMSYFIKMGKKLNLEHPETFNEKMQWLKLYNRDPIYTDLVDKYKVREYVEEKLGAQYLIPLLGVWDTPDQINFESLPDQFVLKCNHDSGSVMICKDKSHFNIDAARKKLGKSLKNNLYYFEREWPYKNVKPKIICEKFMADESECDLKDYKFFCFDGKPEFMFIATDRNTPGEETKFDFYDMNFQHLPFTNGHPNATKELQRPASFERMKEAAEVLSAGIPHVRVDLYDINGTIYFGEMTFFHWSGMVPFDPEEWDYKLGSYIRLPDVIHHTEAE